MQNQGAFSIGPEEKNGTLVLCPGAHVTEVEESKGGGLFHGGETTSEEAKNQAGLLVVRMGRIKEQQHRGEGEK